MPIKIKLSTPLATADIAALTNNLAADHHQTTRGATGRHAAADANSGFPLPPLPQGCFRNHAEFPSEAAGNHGVMATDFSNDGGRRRRNQNSRVSAQPMPSHPPPPPTDEVNFSERNHAAVGGHYNDPPPRWKHQMQQVEAVGNNNPLDIIINQAGYKDFIPPPIHLPKNSEKRCGTATNNDGSAFLPPMNEQHDSPSRIMKKKSNHDKYQQQQHPSLPPLPREGEEKTSENEKGSEVLESSVKRNVTDAPSDSTTDIHQNQRDIVPVYVYSTLHQQKSWNEMIELFTKFVQVNDHTNVEQENIKISTDGGNRNHGDDDNEEEILLLLRSWVRELRYIRNADDSCLEKTSSRKRSAKQQQQQQRCDSETLTPERISQLNELSFPWKNNLTRWQIWLDDLMHYRAKNNGDCNVPVKFPEHAPLGNFVNRQRVEYKKMLQRKPTTMTASKVEDLERIGFVWSVRERGHTSWDARLAELVAFQREHGNTLVPKKYPANPPLGYWVNEQRFQYQRYINGKSSTMNKERQERLNSINFRWSLREAPREFPEWIQLLKEYKRQFGNCNVPLKFEPHKSLGTFVNNARTQYKKFQSGLSSNMTQEKM